MDYQVLRRKAGLDAVQPIEAAVRAALLDVRGCPRAQAALQGTLVVLLAAVVHQQSGDERRSALEQKCRDELAEVVAALMRECPMPERVATAGHPLGR